MKTKLFTFLVLAGLVLFPYWLQAQTFTIITTADTLATGDIIITQTDINGHIIDKGLVMPGFSVENDTSVFTFSIPTPPDNDDDVFTGHIDVPGTYGGFLPQDIVFNPHNDKFYVYGYRKVLICDVNLVPEKTIEISNRDDFSVFYSDYHKQMIDVNPTSNEVYCLTLEGSLIAIDEFYNKTVLVPPIENATVLRASMKYCPLDNSVVYFLLFTDEDGNLKTEVLKYMLTDGNKPSQLLANYIIGYDLEFMPFLNSHRIFVATNNGVQVFNPDLTLAGNIESGAQFGHIEALNGLLFCHKTGVDEIVAYSPSGSLIHEISDAYTGIRFMLSDDESNQIYTCGFNSSGNGVKILTESSGTYSFTEEIDGFPNVFGLDQNATQVVACGENEVVYINKVGYSPTQVSCTSLGQMYRVATTNNPNTAAVVQPLNGNAINFGTLQEDVLDIGGHVNSIKSEGDFMFLAINKYNDEGYISVVNSNTGHIVEEFKPSFAFNPIIIFPGFFRNNQYLYALYYDLSAPTSVKGMYVDLSDNSITVSSDFLFEDFDFAHEVIGYHLVRGENIPDRVLLIRNDETTCLEVNINIFTPELNFVSDIEIPGACYTELKHFPQAGYVVLVSKCSMNIWFIDDGDLCEPESVHFASAPFTIEYHPGEQQFYCEINTNSGHKFYTIDENLTKTLFLSTSNYCGSTLGSFYNENDNRVYMVFNQGIYSLQNEASPIFMVDTDLTLKSGIHRKDDFVFKPDKNSIIFYNRPSNDFLKSIEIIEYNCETNLFGDPISTGLHYSSNPDAYGFPDYLMTYSKDKENLFIGNKFFTNVTLTTTHNETRALTGNWDWVSFPCMPRLGNEEYDSQDLLENIDPLPGYLKLLTNVDDVEYYLTYSFQNWQIQDLSVLKSTQGYVYESNAQSGQDLHVYGTVLEPSTAIDLSSQYENWIGYFLEYPLFPEEAFAGIWNDLTRISTEEWTMILKDGVIIRQPASETPINYGDGLIVEVQNNCELVWNENATPVDDFSLPPTEFFLYAKKANYTPFYFELDSVSGINEIGLTVNDSCVGAAVINPADTIAEVNAYLQGMPSGVPIEVETYSGFKSSRLGSNDYSVLDLKTGKRISRKVYTGEGRPYYVLSFKHYEETTGDPVAILKSPSPNPFSSSVMCSFVLNETAAITMTVHDLQGNPVKTLMQGTYPEGYYETGWIGATDSGKAAGNGIYIIRLTANNKIIANEKVVLIR